MKRLSCIPALLLASVTTSAVQADVIISNLSESITSSTAFGMNSTTQYKAFGFTMGSSDYTLEEVVLSLTSTTVNPTPLVEIYSDAGNTPGVSLFTLDNPAVVTGTDDFVFTAGSPFVLTAGASYWIYVTSVPVLGDSFNWQSAGNVTLPSGPGATAISYEFNGGGSSFYNRLEVRGSSGFGTNYCTAVANSTGLPGVMSAAGSSVVASNDFTLEASQLPNNQFGIFVTSMTSSAGTPAVGSNGNICLGGQVGRFTLASQIVSSGASGMFSLTVDLNAFPQGNGFVPVASGQTWFFQAWYRDGVGAGSNFTDGLEMTFQ